MSAGPPLGDAAEWTRFEQVAMSRLGSAVVPISSGGGVPGVGFLLDEVSRELGDGQVEVRTWLVTAAVLTETDVVRLHVPPSVTDPPGALDVIDMFEQTRDWLRLGPVAVKGFSPLEEHAARKGWSWNLSPINRGASEPTPDDTQTSGPFVATTYRLVDGQFAAHAIAGRGPWIGGLPQIGQIAAEEVPRFTGAPVGLLRPWTSGYRLVCAGLLVSESGTLRVEPLSTVFSAIAAAVT